MRISDYEWSDEGTFVHFITEDRLSLDYVGSDAVSLNKQDAIMIAKQLGVTAEDLKMAELAW